ncbi:MAG: GxxExxY protein [Puniceicoccales bacterium]|jgi:iron complex transport system substrate-binding protein|nr:GxxExxY protein [Puniceicoccales bacterium]
MSSHEDTKTQRDSSTQELVPNAFSFHSSNRKDKEDIARIVVDCSYQLHIELGPGLLESVYEKVLAKMLVDRGLIVRQQIPVPISVMGMNFDEGFRADILVNDILLLELKSVENLAPVHAKQLLTYLRLMKLPLGLLINFGAATFKEGIKRIVNGPQTFASSCLRVNQNCSQTEDKHSH